MSDDTYQLPRNVREAERLEQQGQATEAALGYLIHPHLATALPSSPKIADIGTGTGGYLIRLSKDYPTGSQFHGFDMSSSQFRPPSEVPTNVDLSVQDVRKPFSPEFHRQFDFVHLRYLVLGLSEDEWTTATRNVIDLLKPGGSIQWVEPDVLSSRQLRGGPPGSTVDNLRLACEALKEDLRKSRLPDAFSTLPVIFETLGLQKISQDVVSTDRDPVHRRITTQTALEGATSWAGKAHERGISDPYHGRSVEEVVRKAYEDMNNGAYARYDVYCTIAFKPQSEIGC